MITIATSPVFARGFGSANLAVVLRVETTDGNITKCVVHDRYLYSDGSEAYGNGDYFVDRSDTEPVYYRAYARWLERCAAYKECSIAMEPYV